MLSIRTAHPSDAALISDLGARTFYESYADQNTAEDMAMYLSEHFTPEQMLSEIHDPDALFFIAFLENEVVGYTKVRNDREKSPQPGSLQLQRIYVVKEHKGKGIGAALLEACLEYARNRGFFSIWLSVWEQNPAAIAFYYKCGFVQTGTSVFVLGNAEQHDLVLSRNT